jgi:hypothetical protein
MRARPQQLRRWLAERIAGPVREPYARHQVLTASALPGGRGLTWERDGRTKWTFVAGIDVVGDPDAYIGGPPDA